jgi:hypothetical protein
MFFIRIHMFVDFSRFSAIMNFSAFLATVAGLAFINIMHIN